MKQLTAGGMMDHTDYTSSQDTSEDGSSLVCSPFVN